MDYDKLVVIESDTQIKAKFEELPSGNNLKNILK